MATYSKRLGAPGSVARLVQETLEHDITTYGENMWCVYEYGPRGSIILRAAQKTKAGAEQYMTSADRVLVDVASYIAHIKGAERFVTGGMYTMKDRA